jgi:hypothetical protein
MITLPKPTISSRETRTANQLIRDQTRDHVDGRNIRHLGPTCIRGRISMLARIWETCTWQYVCGFRRYFELIE